MRRRDPHLLLVTLLAAGCTSPSRQLAPSERPAEPVAEPTQPTPPRLHAITRVGGTLVRAPQNDALYLADEDHAVIRRIPLPVDVHTPPLEVKMPGRPAQVLALADRVLVTIRDPGLLMIMRPDSAQGLVEVARVALPPDAWGLAITPDERTAVVTSAWSAKVSAVDLARAAKTWSLDTPREPRGVAVREDGAAAYITHLTSGALTRVELTGAPRANQVVLPPSPLRAPYGKTVSASLGYAATLSPDGRRLFVARHALGALGEQLWLGAPTVDVLITSNDEPLAPLRRGGAPSRLAPGLGEDGFEIDASELEAPNTPIAPFFQPRAVVYRTSTRTVLVASEGSDALVELDALSVDPTLQPLHIYPLGGEPVDESGVATICGAPTGIALSEGESMAWVHCRSTDALAIVRLDAYEEGNPYEVGPVAFITLVEAPLPGPAALGRKLFYNALDPISSGGLGCAGCHPDGRDDGHVWHEAHVTTPFGEGVNFLAAADNQPPNDDRPGGVPRQTPMLAGRVAAEGPYGWNAQSASLVERLREGFSLHRWGPYSSDDSKIRRRAAAIAAFLRTELTPPPREERPLTPDEEHGRAIFTSEAARCSSCHVPETEYTDRMGYPLPGFRPPPGFTEETTGQVFKTPSLRFIAGTAPYYHDGSAATLEALVENNGDRMGRTSHLSKKDKAALVAFLRTL